MQLHLGAATDRIVKDKEMVTYRKIVSQDFDIELAGCRLFARKLSPAAGQSAARPTLVFLHEALGCIELWRDFPQALATATGCDALLYDRRGSGKSDPLTEKRAQDYLHQEAFITLPEVLEKTGVKNPILIGHSDGGTIALLYAAKFPENVRGVITETAHVFVEDVTLRGIRKVLKTYQTGDLKQRLEKYHGENTEAIFRAWHETWLNPNFRSWNVEKFLPHITCPVLVIQGAEDEYGTPAQVDAITSQVSGLAKPLLIPHCGHTPHREARDITLREMTKFIKRFGDLVI